MQNTKEVSTSERVTMASGQMPSRAIMASEMAVPMARARLANCQAISASSTVSTGQGMACRVFSTPVKVASMGVRTA